MKIEVAVFPFHERMLPFVRHFNQAQDTYHICQALAWSGMGLNGKDAAFICRHPSIGIPVVPPTEPQAFLNWQVLLVDCDELDRSTSSFDSFAFFNRLLLSGKQIIVTTKKNDLYSTDGWNTLFQMYSEQIQIFSTAHTTRKNLLIENGVYKTPSLPVIMVGGLITQEDCLEVILALRESLIQQGEIVSCLTGNNMGLLMGMHSYAHIFDKSAAISEEDRAMALNALAQNIIQVERPSLLIVEAPDPMLKYNNIVPNGFGLQTYMTCQTLKPDMLVCSVPFDMATGEQLFSMLSQDFEIRYGAPIVAVHVSNVVVDSLDAVQSHKITRVHTDMRATTLIWDEMRESLSFPTFDVVSDGANELAQLILRQEEAL